MSEAELLEAPPSGASLWNGAGGREREAVPYGGRETGDAVGTACEPESLTALAALLEPLGRWLAATRGPLHRLQVAAFYAQAVPEDALLVRHLCLEGALLVADRLYDSERCQLAREVELEASRLAQQML